MRAMIASITALSGVFASVVAMADTGSVLATGTRIREELTMISDPAIMTINLTPAIAAARDRARQERGGAGAGGGAQSGAQDGGIAGFCDPITVAHTDSTFGGGQYTMQAGFAQEEALGVSFTVDAAHFPIKVDQLDVLFVTYSATAQTTTEWSVLLYEGNPTAGASFVFSSDGTILPHLVMPPGSTGMIIQFVVDPGDPDQIYLDNSGSATWSFAFRIDQHNNQTQNPCLYSPPTSSNAFPATDTSGLAQPSRNWLYAVNCGGFGCPAGWTTFQSLPTMCRPSGDWVMRGFYTPIECGGSQVPGACCIETSCLQLTEKECALAAGNFTAEGTPCTASTCQTSSTVPCCFAATGGCVELSPGNCAAAGGVAGPAGVLCTQHICFPEGACCLPSGSCVGGVSPQECAAMSGVFQGDGTSCASTNCPQPMGASCFSNGFCLVLTQAQATSAGAAWQGAGTNCADGNGNGTADACEQSDPADINGDGLINGQDLALLLGSWGAADADADIDGNGTVGGEDLAALLGGWTG